MVAKGTHRTKEEKARIVMEVLSNSSRISEICRKYNVASSAVYKWRDEFIAGGTAAIEHGRSTVEASLTREINELKGIIGELTITNETLKKIQLTRRGGKP
jgi:transposase-like protein